MNYRAVFHTLGNILILEGFVLLGPLIVALIYHEPVCASAFCATILIDFVVGLLLTRIKKERRHMRAREGFTIVALSWTILSVVGALPFYISGEIPFYLDAFFETVSGITTTGSSILTNIEELSYSMAFWRCETNWLGGMGILVFMLAVMPLKSESTVYLFRAEAPGPDVNKIVPKMRDSAFILYAIYVVLTLIEIIALKLCGMTLFDSITHTFATAGTGGFSTKNASLGAFNHTVKSVVTVFMWLFGVNFNMYFLLLLRRYKVVFKNSEIRMYIGITIFAVATVTLNILPQYGSLKAAFSDASFTVISILSTTGFTTVNYNMWPGYSQIIILLLMFTGACAGSTSGGLKISRFMLLGKGAKQELRKLTNPRSVKNITMNGKTVSTDTINSVYSFFVLYAVIYVISLVLVSFNNYDMLTSLSSVVSALNNIGPGFGMVGPAGNFHDYNVLSKVVLSIDMLVGRLEIFPMVILILPGTWKRY